jgi:hypothetical protein
MKFYAGIALIFVMAVLAIALPLPRSVVTAAPVRHEAIPFANSQLPPAYLFDKRPVSAWKAVD